MGAEKTGDVGCCINHNIVLCLIYIKAIVEREEGLAAADAAAAEKLAAELGHNIEDLKRWGVV